MNLLGLTSRYARVGIFFAIWSLMASVFFFSQSPRYANSDWSYQVQAADFVQPSWSGDNAEYREFREYVAETEYSGPCFEVNLDETVAGYATDYRTDLFGDTYIPNQEALIDELAEGLSTSFLDKTWEMDKDCFSGSFVVSFDVDEDGTLGQNILVHHLRGGSNNAAFAIMEVLWDMERSGHTWHDGTQGKGEVRIPVSFRLI
ncbi:MAG: hypothetical protein AAGF89_07140 [Bacteroidota bacterium]